MLEYNTVNLVSQTQCSQEKNTDIQRFRTEVQLKEQ